MIKSTLSLFAKPKAKGAAIWPSLLFVLVLLGCSNNPKLGAQSDSWLSDGSILISSPAPQISTLEISRLASNRLLGFKPNPNKLNPSDFLSGETPTGIWLKIDSALGAITLMDESKTVLKVNSASNTGKFHDLVSPGRYQIMHKQINPAWHAPDSYFIDRKLDVPAEGDKLRLRRGALGSQALFISPTLAIHNGPDLSTPASAVEVEGLRLSKLEMAKLFKSLPVGAPVIVY